MIIVNGMGKEKDETALVMIIIPGKTEPKGHWIIRFGNGTFMKVEYQQLFTTDVLFTGDGENKC